MSESRGNACIHFAEREQARPEVNLGEVHRKHSFLLMANELKMSHITVSLIFAGLQVLINLGFIYVCPLIVDKFAQEGQTLLCNSLVLVHWIYLFVAFLVLAVAYVLFKKNYYHLHEEYLASLKK